MQLTIAQEIELKVIVKKLQIAKNRWCTGEVDDPEEMWQDIPELLNDIVPKLEEMFT